LKEAREHFTCTGSDISDYAISQARKRLPDDVVLYSGVLDEIDIHLRFDVITCFDVLEHIPDLNTALDNIEHLLRPGGLLVFTVPVYDGPVGSLVQKMDQDETHLHKEGRDFWLKLLNSTTFNTIYWAGVWRYFMFKHIYVNYVSHIGRRWTPAIMVISEKGD
jgi:SAM-dependent methyltransferase